MNKILLLLFLGTFFNLHAQPIVWKTNMSDAIEISNKTRKPLMILFTANNMDGDLQAEVFKTYDFTTWSNKNVILVRLDLSDSSAEAESKEANIKLKNAFGIQELPVVCFAKASTRNSKTTFQFLGKVAYDRKGLRSWINQSENVLNNEE